MAPAKPLKVPQLARGLDEGYVSAETTASASSDCRTRYVSEEKVASASSAHPGRDEGDDAWAEQAKGIFLKYDANGDGCIDEDELGLLLQAISDKFTKADVRVMLRAADTDGSNKIEFSEFINWLLGPSKESLGRAVTENASSLELLFNVYDKEHTGVISMRQFEECHCILQAALRLAHTDNDVDVDDSRADDDVAGAAHALRTMRREARKQTLQKEASELINHSSESGMVGFLDFVDWMKQHIPDFMDQDEFFEFAKTVADTLEESFEHELSCETGYIREKADVLAHLREKFSDSMKTWRRDHQRIPSKGIQRVRPECPWDNLPKGLSIDRLKAAHMMMCPIPNMRYVKEISWEILCLPWGSPPGEVVWVAEVVRRILVEVPSRGSKLKVEEPEYYRYDVSSPVEEAYLWVSCNESEQGIFSCMQPGLGVYSMLKTIANFGSRLRWSQIQTALEGSVDMRLIREDDVETFNEEITKIVLQQMEEDGIMDGDPQDAKLQHVQRYLANELELHPGMVMVTLLKLEIVDTDPLWADFALDA